MIYAPQSMQHACAPQTFGTFLLRHGQVGTAYARLLTGRAWVLPITAHLSFATAVTGALQLLFRRGIMAFTRCARAGWHTRRLLCCRRRCHVCKPVEPLSLPAARSRIRSYSNVAHLQHSPQYSRGIADEAYEVTAGAVVAAGGGGRSVGGGVSRNQSECAAGGGCVEGGGGRYFQR